MNFTGSFVSLVCTIKYASITNFSSAQMFTFSSFFMQSFFTQIKKQNQSGAIVSQWKLFIVTSAKRDKQEEG